MTKTVRNHNFEAQMAIEYPEQWVNERSRLSHQYGMVLPTDDIRPLVDEIQRQRDAIAELVMALDRLCASNAPEHVRQARALLARHGVRDDE